MNKHAIYHKPKSNFCYPYDKNIIHIRLRTAKEDVEKVILVYGDKYEWNKNKKIEMKYSSYDKLFDYYMISVKPFNRRLAYYFIMESKKKLFYYTEWGILDNHPDQNEIHNHFFEYPYINDSDIHVVPEWVKDAVFYQIFPERFYNGDTSNDPKKINQWGELPKRNDFFGGDLKGIIDRLDYIKDLGINAIYFTPIFESDSNHKYNIKDYKKIDPHFGNLDILKELVEKCHQYGIKVILDAVFNHSGSDFKPFLDIIKNGKNSPYYNWFYIHKWPIKTNPPNYETFSFVAKMPKLNTTNPEVKKYLLHVVKYWMEEVNIDGWRLDVADEIDHNFWREFRKAVKSIKKDAYIVGEIWHNSLPWLMGDQFDAVMNYPFRTACLKFFAYKNIDEETFKKMINQTLFRNTQQVNEVMFNLLDSHDTSRFINRSNKDIKRLILASVFQMTFIGTPCVYYGTEIGLEGEDDPDCRRTMEWNEEKWNKNLHNHYKNLIKLKKEHISLRRGNFKWINDLKNIIGFIRETDNEKILVLINNHENKKNVSISINHHKCIDLINNQKIDVLNKKLKISLPEYGFKIILIRKNDNKIF